jgi:DNA sulfur modification protein DndD
MRLLELTVENFGVFQGSHTFDLRPYGALSRPLVLVIGHNGAGKTTLFHAVSLALQGARALGDRTSQQAYQNHLRDKFHFSRSKPGVGEPADSASVRVLFEYVRSGEPLQVDIRRSWRRLERSVAEDMQIIENEKPISVPAEDLEVWLSGLVPPALAALCLFDGERLDLMSDIDQYAILLKEALDRLLGLDLVGRLQADLDYLSTRHGGSRALERLRDDVLQCQFEVDQARARLEDFEAAYTLLQAEVGDVEAQRLDAERKLAAAGGTYAARRPILQERLQSSTNEAEECRERLRGLVADLLPFSLAPELALSLGSQLDAEAAIRRTQVAEELWQTRVRALSERLHADRSWSPSVLAEDEQETLINHIIGFLQPEGHDQPPTLGIHRLSEVDHEKVQNWVYKALGETPSQAKLLGDRLRVLQQEQASIRQELRRAPEDDALVELHASIADLHQQMEALASRRRGLEQQGGSLRSQLAAQERRRDRTATELSTAQAEEQQMRLAEDSRLVLRVYKDALTRRQLARVEELLVESFNAVCQKDHLLGSVSIDPETCRPELRGQDGSVIPLTSLSAGERQLFALATIRSLRDASGRQLPLVIDSPTARLDGAHRKRFWEQYVPAAGGQSILFLTDAEADEAALRAADQTVARIYRLSHDRNDGVTRAAVNESWEGRVIALRA